MRKLFGANFFCCSGTRTLGNETNSTFLSMFENDLIGSYDNQQRRGTMWAPSSESELITSNIRYKQKQNSRHLRNGLRQRTLALFSEMNKKRDNMLTFTEFFSYLASKGSNIDRFIAEKVFRKYDTSETGYLTFLEFCKICPPDGNFPHAVQVEARGVMNTSGIKNRSTKNSRRRKRKKNKRLVRTINDPIALSDDYVPSHSFLQSESPPRISHLTGINLSDDELQSINNERYVSRGSYKSAQYEQYMDSSSEDNPELMVLYARSTSRSIYSSESPRMGRKSGNSQALPQIKSSVVKFLDETEEDFTSPELEPVINVQKTPNLEECFGKHSGSGSMERNYSSLVSFQESMHPEKDESMVHSWEPSSVLEVVAPKKSPSTSNGSRNGSLALSQSPETSAGSLCPAQIGAKFLVHIDYGPLEIPSKLLVERGEGVCYIKEVVSRMKRTPSHSICIRHRGRVITKSPLSLEQLGLEDHPELMVNLSGGVPLDEAKRVVSMNKRLFDETSTQLGDYAAYVCHTPASRGAIERIISGMAQKGCTIFDPVGENLVSTNVKQLVNAINRCDLFLLFITRYIVSDSWVLLQILVASKLRKDFYVVFETDPRLGGFAASSLFSDDILQLLPDMSRNTVMPWFDKRYQQCEIFDHLAKQIALYKHHCQPKQSDTVSTLQYNRQLDASTVDISHSSTTSSYSPSLNREKEHGVIASLRNETSEDKKVSFSHEGTTPIRDDPKQRSFKPTKNRLATYKIIAQARKFEFSITDMDTYLKQNNLFLTSEELADLFATISTRKKSNISMAEFIKYCPPNGGFAEKVWLTIVKCRS